MQKQNGFTLTEIIVVTGIILLLAAVALLGLRAGASESALRRNAQLVMLDLRRAQNFALAARAAGGSTPYGYGVYFSVATGSDKTKYILFADMNNNLLYDGTPTDTIVDTVYLEQGIQITSLQPASPLHIFFCPPNPNTFINATTGSNCSGSGSSDGRITLSLIRNPEKTRTVRVTTAGLIGLE